MLRTTILPTKVFSTKYPVEYPRDELKWCQQNVGRTSIVSILKANCLVIIDLDLLENMILLQGVEDCSVDFTKEFSNIVLILGDDHEAIVVQNITFY